MSCLPAILDALARHGGSVRIAEHTLRSRGGAALRALRPDLAFAKQVDHWAQSQHLVCHYDPARRQFQFTRLEPKSKPEEDFPKP